MFTLVIRSMVAQLGGGLLALFSLLTMPIALADQPMINVPGKGAVPIYRAQYFSKDNKLMNVEEVTDLAGREIHPMGGFTVPQVTAATPVLNTDATVMGATGGQKWTVMKREAEYAIYLGTEDGRIPADGAADVKLVPCGIEHVAGKFRAFSEATLSEDPSCLFPKTCTCGPVGCCCR